MSIEKLTKLYPRFNEIDFRFFLIFLEIDTDKKLFFSNNG